MFINDWGDTISISLPSKMSANFLSIVFILKDFLQSLFSTHDLFKN